ncbi:MAG: hypothetical protein HYZ84_00145 [Candidatus Omnitrophica bacterium]|nr:hypothetical protein [Candidatus Omnitrophota bacterium]
MFNQGQLKYLPAYLFHIIIIFVIIHSYAPARFELRTDVLRNLLQGFHQDYALPGSELEPFKKVLPAAEIVSFLTDHPFGKNLDEEKIFNDARLYLAPIILNPEPMERVAIVYCSSQEIADQRLAENGYQWAAVMTPGKGVAVKK